MYINKKELQTLKNAWVIIRNLTDGVYNPFEAESDDYKKYVKEVEQDLGHIAYDKGK